MTSQQIQRHKDELIAQALETEDGRAALKEAIVGNYNLDHELTDDEMMYYVYLQCPSVALRAGYSPPTVVKKKKKERPKFKSSWEIL
jgi:hypothetical protein